MTSNTSHALNASGDGQQHVEPLQLKHIVVGIDGSPNSIEALRVAAGYAARDDANVEAVCVYYPHLYATNPFDTVPVPSHGPAGEGERELYAPSTSDTDGSADAQSTLEDAAASALGARTLVNLVLRPINGREHRAHEVLTTLAAEADLLVVGARGHSGALSLLLGSTAQACTRHATCPVLVVPSVQSTQST